MKITKLLKRMSLLAIFLLAVSALWAQDSNRDRWQQLTPEQKQFLRQAYQNWQKMSPEQKQEIKNRLKRFKELPLEDQNRIRENFKRFQQLSPGER